MAGSRAGMPYEDDVIDLLIAQHALIRDLFSEVKNTEGEAREQAFYRLRHMLAVHETAEEEVLHPVARADLEDGNAVVADRLAEENDAKKLLSRLEDLEPGTAQFMALLDPLRFAVLTHARSEERYEFIQLRDRSDPATLRSMARAVRAAEATAPTHPHPDMESAIVNLAAGPFVAIVDRVKDAIRGTSGRSTDPRA
jgi:hemerythrin superfamily protein